MKKYSALVAITLVVILTLYFGGNFVKSQIKEVDVLVLQEQEVKNSIVCSGQLEPSDNKNVYITEPSIAQEVLVQVGDRVEQGEDLLRVRKGVAPKTTNDSDNRSDTDNSSLPSSFSEFAKMTGLSSEQAAEVYNQYINGSSSGSSSSAEPIQKEEEGELDTITAPVSGIVSVINVKGNSYADTSKPIMVISDINSMQVRLSVNESQISAVQIGQKATITGAGFKNSEYSGTVKSIADVATQTVSTSGQETVVEVIVTVDHAGEDLKSGLTAKCEITTSNDDGMLIAPYEAVRAEDDGQEYVYIYQDGRAVKRTITTGREFNSGFEILSGLKTGDRIITNPERLYANSRVIMKQEKSVVNQDA
ncbi:MAG: efflux RND transporter periplasmic adaptor subunit [Clostridiales bacterium]|jgi:RND family efflux transporter MFP subunit|nr:efflux RND transporter periplasmic adaptor subunit [Clostridiales bacterium]